ncbi:aldehyde dehydrogenase family protein, partial [Calditerricola satsumensis]
MRKEKMWVAGSWCASEDGRTFAVTDPATGEVVGEVPDATEADVRRAVEAAHQAFPEWAGLPARKRSDVLYAWYRRILDHQEDLARLLTREQGKPLAEARGEIAYAAQFVLWYAEEANRVYGYTVPASSPTKRIQVLRQPVGVVAAITPWNFPAAMVTRKVAPAL